MTKHLREEQQLLQLKAEVLRLKLLTQQAQRQRQQPDRLSETLGLLEKLPAAGLAWRAVNLPKRLSSKALIAAALLAWAYWRA